MLGRKAGADGKQLCEGDKGRKKKKSRMETSEGRKLIRPTSRSLPGKYRELQAGGEEVKPSVGGGEGKGEGEVNDAELSVDDTLPLEGAGLCGKTILRYHPILTANSRRKRLQRVPGLWLKAGQPPLLLASWPLTTSVENKQFGLWNYGRLPRRNRSG